MTPWDLIEERLMEGAQYGWNRAHKHVDSPKESVIIESIVEHAMNSLHDILPLLLSELMLERIKEKFSGE